MKIQLITGNKKLKSDKQITVSDITHPMALDNYDYNIIDLSFDELWKYDGSTAGRLNHEIDLINISQMVMGTNKATIIYVYPQDITYKYEIALNRGEKSCKVKEIVCSGKYSHDYELCFPPYVVNIGVIFEPSSTTIGEREINADFHFFHEYSGCITKSDISDKATTIYYSDKLILTTLDICKSADDCVYFIKETLLPKRKEEIPEWVKNYYFYDDKEQRERIVEKSNCIVKLKQEILNSQSQLDTNNRYKTILFSTGDQLVEVVFEILELIFDCELSNFVDKKNEDFYIEKDNDVFVGEIKGINTNVKSENVSQIDRHCSRYIDDCEETGESAKNVHGLLIINPFRNKNINEREKIHDNQISLAKNRNCLIIETETLLKVFELFLKKEVDSNQIIEIIKNNTGLLSIDLFEK